MPGTTSVNPRNHSMNSTKVAQQHPFTKDINSQLLAAINADPDVAVILVSIDGQVEGYTPNAPKLFGADPHRSYEGLSLNEIFDDQFVNERLNWFREVIQQGRPMRCQHIYQGDRMVSTILPHDRESHPPLLSVLTRRERRKRNDLQTSRYLDIAPLEKLSSRELEVMVLLGHGFSVPEIAKMLYRSTRTIEQHKANLGRKLGSPAVANISRLVGQFGLQIEDLELNRIQALRQEFRYSSDSGS